jgi:hypothetical protein
MVILSFQARAEIAGISVSFNTAIPVGMAVDQPLNSNFNTAQPGAVIGNIGVLPVLNFGSFETTIAVNVGVGDHYVILGIALPSVTLNTYRLVLSGAGQSIDKTFSLVEPLTYVYIAFRINRDNSITPLGTGTISPGGTPILSTGGGGIWSSGGDPAEAMAAAMGPMLEMMIPIMMMSMMIQMITGMIQGLAAGMQV